MRVTAFMGEQDLRSVTLNDSERATLRRAAAILTDLRTRLEDGREDFDDETVVDVALAAHTCNFLVTEDCLPIF